MPNPTKTKQKDNNVSRHLSARDSIQNKVQNTLWFFWGTGFCYFTVHFVNTLKQKDHPWLEWIPGTVQLENTSTTFGWLAAIRVKFIPLGKI